MLESQSWKNKIVTKMGRLKRWWYLSKLFTFTITSFNFFNCLVKLQRNLKLKFRSKFNHDFTNHGSLYSSVWNVLYNFKKKVPRRQDITNFSFKMFEIMRSFMLVLFPTGNMMLLTFTVFDRKYLFGQTWSKKWKLSVWAEISH